MNHILDLNEQLDDLHDIYKKMHEGNAILFLGAGASVGEKTYLSQQIITYYEDYLGKSFKENDITKFVDILSADPTFKRNHFDNEVEKMLRKYKITSSHKILSTIRWREIITTNFDLLIEETYDSVKNTSSHISDIVPIRELRDFHYRPSNDEIKYIKLNGCISDKGKYPLAFSSDDFKSRSSFYKNVLTDLKNLSEKIIFITIGYSFSDAFAVDLLEKFDSFNYRDKRWMVSVDAFPQENSYHYYSQQKRCIVKASFNDFFLRYQEWESTLSEKKGPSFEIHNTNFHVRIPNQLASKIQNRIRILDENTKAPFIKDADFYLGEEPNYQLILRNVDVIRKNSIREMESKINNVISQNKSTLIPLFFVCGDFGIGKSTFTLRLIHHLTMSTSNNLIAFEIIDFLDLKKEYLVELFNLCSAKTIILYCDEVELESTFKAIIELRRELSIEQFNDFNLFFLIPIRQNILEKYRQKRDISRAFDLVISGKLNESESRELVEKLKTAKILNFRDQSEKKALVQQIKDLYSSDSFVSLLSLVTNGRHVNDLLSAYSQLSQIAKKAFMFTALLHRFKILMPSSLLKNILGLDWETFTNEVIKGEGRGILIQQDTNSNNTDPDLYFRTKHPIIADELVKRILENKDAQYRDYEKIFQAIDVGTRNSYLIINLLKAFIKNEIYSTSKINRLYDLAHNKLSDDPYYILNFSMNLQNRGSKEDLLKALKLLIYAESLLPGRNHRFIHRRAVINFELAKHYKKIETEPVFTLLFLREAEELFKVKQLIDPFSIYSYENFIQFLIWKLEKMELETEEQLRIKIQIDDLLEIAKSTITDDITRLNDLMVKFTAYITLNQDSDNYKEYLNGLYEDASLRPYACILLYHYYLNKEDFNPCYELIEEMRDYLDNNEVVKFLFKYLGSSLHLSDHRAEMFWLSENHPIIKETNQLRYHFYRFVGESYNHSFYKGMDELKEIKSKNYGLNPEFHYVWLTEDGQEAIFDGKIIKRNLDKYKSVKITNLQQRFKLIKGNYDLLLIGSDVKVKLHFYLYGIIAEIVTANN